MLTNSELIASLHEAIAFFWKTRSRQGSAQGAKTGQKDDGNRQNVTGGKQLDGFVELFARMIESEGIPQSAIHVKATTARILSSRKRIGILSSYSKKGLSQRLNSSHMLGRHLETTSTIELKKLLAMQRISILRTEKALSLRRQSRGLDI